MAITITEQPSGIVSAYAPMILKMFDTSATSDGVIVATVEINDGTGRWKSYGQKTQYKYKNSHNFVFDVRQEAQRGVTFDYPNQSGSAIILAELNSAATVRVALEHFEPVSGVMTSQSSTTSSSWVVCNTIPDDRTDTDLTDYILNDDGSKLFLTRQKTQFLRDGEHLQFHFLWDESQLGTDVTMRSYPLSGSPSNSTISLQAFDYETAAFEGIEGDTLTSSPTLTTSNASLVRITDSLNKEWVGVQIDGSGSDYFQFANTDVGKKLKLEVFAMATGTIDVTFVGSGAGVTTLTVSSTGYTTFTTGAIPASTTAIKVENKMSTVCYVTWANIVEETYSTITENRAILYIDEYDATLEKIELWVENDSTQITETLTVKMAGCSNGKRLAWLSKRGTMEHYTFTWGDQSERSISKNEILSESTEPTGEQRGYRTPSAESIDMTTVYTRFETPETMQWLAEIAESPEVYLVNAYNDRVPVSVINSSFPLGGKRLVQGAITFKTSYNNIIQNG